MDTAAPRPAERAQRHQRPDKLRIGLLKPDDQEEPDQAGEDRPDYGGQAYTANAC